MPLKKYGISNYERIPKSRLIFDLEFEKETPEK